MKSSFERMKPCFEGKETEFNWIERDKSIGEIRGMLVGGVCERDEEEWKAEFVKCIKEVQDGIIKTVGSFHLFFLNQTLADLDSLMIVFIP